MASKKDTPSVVPRYLIAISRPYQDRSASFRSSPSLRTLHARRQVNSVQHLDTILSRLYIRPMLLRARVASVRQVAFSWAAFLNQFLDCKLLPTYNWC